MIYTETVKNLEEKTSRSFVFSRSLGGIAHDLLKTGVNNSIVVGNVRKVFIDKSLPHDPYYVWENGHVGSVYLAHYDYEFTLPLEFPWDEFMNDRISFVKLHFLSN